jgi:hypothetical protein
MRKWPRRREHVFDRRAAAGAREVVGVLAVRECREFQALAGFEQRQSEIDRAIGGTPPRVVAVETEDRDVKATLASIEGTEALIEGFGASSGRPVRSL